MEVCGVILPTYNPSTHDVKEERSEAQDDPQLHGKFKAGLCYMTLSQNKSNKLNNKTGRKERRREGNGRKGEKGTELGSKGREGKEAMKGEEEAGEREGRMGGEGKDRRVTSRSLRPQESSKLGNVRWAMALQICPGRV